MGDMLKVFLVMGVLAFLWRIVTGVLGGLSGGFKRRRQQANADRIGLEAELAVKATLEARGIPVLHDVYLRHPSGRLTQIDLLALTSDGIQAIEVKGHRGAVEVDASKADWALVYPDGRRFSLKNPVRQNAYHVAAIRHGFGKNFAVGNHVIFTDAILRGAADGVHPGIPSWHAGTVDKVSWAVWCKLRDAHAAGDHEGLRRQHRRGLGLAA